jgi:uncharacterized membrane protein
VNKVFRHLRTFIFRGLLAVIPLVLVYFVVRFLYLAVDQRVAGLVEKRVGFAIPGLGVVIVLLILYLLGLAASNWAGKQFFNVIDRVSGRIPLVKTIYNLGKQLGKALARPEKQAFRRVVMVEFFRPGLWSVGFVTGSVADKTTGEKSLKVFIPTAPNPTAGFMVVVREEAVRPLDWTVQEAMNAILSGGVAGPDSI